jgi:hypothetical protein
MLVPDKGMMHNTTFTQQLPYNNAVYSVMTANWRNVKAVWLDARA